MIAKCVELIPLQEADIQDAMARLGSFHRAMFKEALASAEHPYVIAEVDGAFHRAMFKEALASSRTCLYVNGADSVP